MSDRANAGSSSLLTRSFAFRESAPSDPDRWDKLAAELRDLESVCRQRVHELASIRATLLVNFGEGAKHNLYGFSIKDEGTTHAMMVIVLEHLALRASVPPCEKTKRIESHTEAQGRREEEPVSKDY